MRNSLGEQMLVAYDVHSARGEPLAKEHQVVASVSELDDFSLVVRNRFFLGVHTAYLEAILQALRDELRTQQKIADALGLKDRTSIAQMIRSGTMDGIRITAALYEYSHLINLPTREIAALFGFARATSYIKALAYRDEAIEGTMSAQEFSYLVGVLASTEWDAAIRDANVKSARGVAAQIVRERTIDRIALPQMDKARPEQIVLMLRQLWVAWADFSVIALWTVPECIPSDDE
jgi:hypothetical protein